MGLDAIFSTEYWRQVPFQFWSGTFFVFGCVVGSFLNVCIYRMPLDMSLVTPRSHCPSCQKAIPWYLNVPLLTWLFLRGRCAQCGAPISIRYFGVELLTGLSFMACWMVAGRTSPWVALIYCLIMSGLIVATFIDFEHFIIPDAITIGGTVVGFLCSFAVPALHGREFRAYSLLDSLTGLALGGGVVYLILRLGKLLFGRQKIQLEQDSKILFTETCLVLPDEEVPFEEIFYRKSDTITLVGKRVELVDRCYQSVPIRLRPEQLEIGEERLDPEKVPYMEVVTDGIVLPREAMGLGDVKFMAAIGAFLGMQATVFTLVISSVLGAFVGAALIVLRKREWSSRIPFGPYIALAAAIWIYGGNRWMDWWLHGGWIRF